MERYAMRVYQTRLVNKRHKQNGKWVAECLKSLSVSSPRQLMLSVTASWSLYQSCMHTYTDFYIEIKYSSYCFLDHDFACCWSRFI